MSIEDVKNDIRVLLADINQLSDITSKEDMEEIINGICNLYVTVADDCKKSKRVNIKFFENEKIVQLKSV